MLETDKGTQNMNNIFEFDNYIPKARTEKKDKQTNYIIYDIVNYKTNIRGYYINNNNKLDVDNIKKIEKKTFKSALNCAINICIDKKQECALIQTNKVYSYLIDRQGKTIKRFTITKHFNIDNVYSIRYLIKKYKGLTVIKKYNKLHGVILT